jgi:hypothetical protein
LRTPRRFSFIRKANGPNVGRAFHVDFVVTFASNEYITPVRPAGPAVQRVAGELPFDTWEYQATYLSGTSSVSHDDGAGRFPLPRVRWLLLCAPLPNTRKSLTRAGHH